MPMAINVLPKSASVISLCDSAAMTDGKPRRSLGRGVPLTRLQWTVIVAALVVAVVGMTTLIILGSPWAGAVGGIAGIVVSGVVFSGWSRNERISQGK